MIISIIVFLIGFLGLTIIPPGKIGIIERIGKFKFALTGPKKKFLFPFIHQVILIDQVNTIKFNRVKLTTHDKDYTVSTELTYQVLDGKLFFYQRRQAIKTIKAKLVEQARNHFSNAHNTINHDSLKQTLEPVLNDASHAFGFVVLEFNVIEINVSTSV